MRVDEYFLENEPDNECLRIDGYDDAIIGAGNQYTKENVLVYCYNRIIKICMESYDLEELEAIEYVDFNIVGAWIGEGTPIILHYCTCQECEKDGIVDR